MTNRSEDQAGPNMYAHGSYAGRRVYEFRCTHCGASGKIAVPMTYRTFNCPNDAMSEGRGPCPAVYIQWQPPEAAKKGSWALRCVNSVAAGTALELRELDRKLKRQGLDPRSTVEVLSGTSPGPSGLVLPFRKRGA